MTGLIVFVAVSVYWYLGFCTGRRWERGSQAKREALKAKADYYYKGGCNVR
jgi:hypothetical protein